MFINRRKDKEDIYYIRWSISHKKNKIRSLVEIWMDLDSVTEWSKSETLKQILYINTYMWSVENDVCGGFPSDSDGKESACNVRDSGSIPGSGRFPGEGNGNSLQYFCLENPMGRGAWWVTVHGDTHNWVTNTHTHTHTPALQVDSLPSDPPGKPETPSTILFEKEKWETYIENECVDTKRGRQLG